MTDSSRVERAREFVRKFNNHEYEYIKNPTEDQLDTLERLAFAKTDFEKADEEKSNWSEEITGLIDPYNIDQNRRTLNYNFENALKHLHNWMNIADVGELYQDSKIKKEIEEFKANKSIIEKENERYIELNKKLVTESAHFRKGLIKIFAEFPEAEVKYGWLLESQKIGESKLD